jgi:predicted flap endonuclease-1-like 5' DNA nuclease
LKWAAKQIADPVRITTIVKREKTMKLDEIEGIGASYAAKLETAGIKNIDQLLEKAGSAKGRDALADTTGVKASLLLEWVNHVDLMRIKGVGSEYSDLLEEAGVDSCPELSHRNAANLVAKMTELNEKKKIVRRVPTESEVEGWIEQAKSLPKVVTH